MKKSKFFFGVLIFGISLFIHASTYQFACKVSYPNSKEGPAVEVCYQYESDYDISQRPPGSNAEWVIKCENKGNAQYIKSKVCPDQGSALAYCENNGVIIVMAKPFQEVITPGGGRTAKYEDKPFTLKQFAYNNEAKKLAINACDPNNLSLLGGFDRGRKLWPEKVRAQTNFKRIGNTVISNFPIEKDLCSQAFLYKGISCYKNAKEEEKDIFQFNCVAEAEKAVKEVCKRNFDRPEFKKYWDFVDKNYGTNSNMFRSWFGE